MSAFLRRRSRRRFITIEADWQDVQEVRQSPVGRLKCQQVARLLSGMTRLTSLPSKGRTLCWRGSPGNVVGPRRGGAVFLIWGTCSCFVPLLVGVNTVVFSVIEHVTGGADAKSATHFVLALCITTSRSTVSHPDTLNLNIYMLTRSPSPAPGSRPTWPRAPLIEGMLALSPQKNDVTAQGTQFLHSHARGAYAPQYTPPP